MTDPKVESIVFVAELPQLPEMLAWVRDKAEETGFDSSQCKKIEVALEETLVNIISYAYETSDGTVEIIAKWLPDHYLKMIIKDRGKPFDPTAYVKTAQTDHSIENIEIGGLGITLVREFMDEVCYQRDGVYNVLTLQKHCRQIG